MKKLMCLFVVFLISNAANAADKWEYVSFRTYSRYFELAYPDGKTDSWQTGETKPPKNFSLLFKRSRIEPPLPPALANKDFTKYINVINALGFLGFEMCGIVAPVTTTTHYYFKRKILK